jgi:hypothetical protein
MLTDVSCSCVEQLAGLGYLPEEYGRTALEPPHEPCRSKLTMLCSYAFLDDDDWWCSCAGHLGKDECLFEEAFEEAMDRRDGFNPEAVGDEEYDEILRLARTRHANYPQIPDVFWYYWEDEDDDGFGLDDDERSEDGQWQSCADARARGARLTLLYNMQTSGAISETCTSSSARGTRRNDYDAPKRPLAKFAGRSSDRCSSESNSRRHNARARTSSHSGTFASV